MNTQTKIDKSYELITSRYRLSTLEQKLILTIISKIRPADTDFMHYQIPISEFEFLTKNENHSRLRIACKALMSKPLEIYTNEEDWTLFNWFSHIKYKKGLLECSVSPELKPYLLQLKGNFKSYALKYALKMDSSYSIRIYELLKKSEFVGYATFKLDDLYDMLIVPNSYKVYGDFKKRVLKPAFNEIALYTDIYIDKIHEIKHDKKVVEIKIDIRKNYTNLLEDEAYKLSNFKKQIVKDYENKKICYHHKLDRHITIKNGLLAVFESNTILTKEKAFELWKWLLNNKKEIIPIEEMELSEN